MTTPPFTAPGAGADRLRQLTDQMATMATRAREAGQQIDSIAAEATSRDRAVTVVVGSGGVLKSVRPGSAASSVSPVMLCASIMEAYGRAARSAAQEASALMEQVVGRDTQAMQRMRAAMPPSDEGDDDAGSDAR